MRSLNRPVLLLLPFIALATSLPAAHGQEITTRLWQWRVKKTLQEAMRKQRHARLGASRPVWVAVAQIQPSEPASSQSTGASTVPLALTPGGGGRPITVYADFGLGFDGQTAVISDPAPREVRISRRIRVVNLTGEYPMGARTRLVVGVPYVSQTAKISGAPTQRGSGVGDASVYVEQRFPESKSGVESSVGAGIVLPTGSDPYSLGANELATGNGFYQPYVRLAIRKLQVPLQLFAAVNYGQTLSRTVGGQRIKLPSSYGGEVGFAYAISPEFSATSSISASRVSSPFLLDTGSHVGYLTQALSYAAGDRTNLRLAADVGLTDDSTDAFLTFTVREEF